MSEEAGGTTTVSGSSDSRPSAMSPQGLVEIALRGAAVVSYYIEDRCIAASYPDLSPSFFLAAVAAKKAGRGGLAWVQDVCTFICIGSTFFSFSTLISWK